MTIDKKKVCNTKTRKLKKKDLIQIPLQKQKKQIIYYEVILTKAKK
jgi:hypothetical protein